MSKKKTKKESQKGINNEKQMRKSEAISYRLKCAKTANGLSHFVMYGDVPKTQAPL